MLPEFMQQELDESQGSPDRRRALQAGYAMEASQGICCGIQMEEGLLPLSLSTGVEVGLLHL